jgi:hypothetical protein
LHTGSYSNLIFGNFSGKLAITRLVPVNTLSGDYLVLGTYAAASGMGSDKLPKQIGEGLLALGETEAIIRR